jgi:PAS domain S-box-containing protein
MAHARKLQRLWRNLGHPLGGTMRLAFSQLRQRLRLRYKILLAVIGSLTSLLVLLYIISATILLDSIQKAEDQSTRQIAEGVQQTFKQIVQDFGDRFPDWSAWDDTYKFIKDSQDGVPTTYIDSNLAPEAMASLKVNLVMYWDLTGQIVYETEFDLAQKRKVAVTDAIRKHIYANSPLLRTPDRQKVLTGILLLPQGPMLLTSQPILTSRESGPMRGTLIFGRYIDISKFQKLTPRYHVNVYQTGDVRLPPDFGSLPSPLTQTAIQVQPLNEQVIGGYLLLRDLYEQPALMMRVDVPRDIYQQGRQTLEGLMIALIVLGITFGITAQVLLEKLILFWHKRRESEVRYRAVITQATEGIFLLDAQTKTFLEANRALQTMLGYDLRELLKLTLYDVVIGDRDSVDHTLQQLLAAQQNQISEQQYRCHDGNIIHVEVSVNDISYANQAVLSLVVRDVSERKQAEITLKQLYHQVQQLNAELETQVTDRTAQLKQALSYESTLKRITDKVRDSLDEAQILQTAVQELALSLTVPCCNATLYDLEHQTAIILYEHVAPELSPGIGQTILMSAYAEIYQQLLQRQYVQCCFFPSRVMPIWQCQSRYALLACPLMDEQSVIGNIWLLKPLNEAFSELEIRLVQQVANQCAIALRQFRLYQVAQAQVQELERLNHLKDDFLSTVSHELRTPMASIKMAIQMLAVALQACGLDVLHQPESAASRAVGPTAQQPPVLASPQTAKVARYFKILQDECQREIGLINDLLDLSRLDAGAESLVPSTIDLAQWLPNLVAPFADRAKNQQQSLKLEIAPDLPRLTTDLSKLERILTELLNNACKYTPAEEKISISVSATVQKTLRFSVDNSGVTLPTDELTRIFDKFYRIPNNDPWQHSGTGLGLALVQKLTALLGGTIAVSSQTNTIRFTVELPLHPCQ